MKSLPYENYVKENRSEFLAKVREIARDLEIPPSWLMVVMWNESHITPWRDNGLGYVGLIQFGSDARQELGVSYNQLRSMSNVEQLDYVYQFYAKYAGKFTEFSDLYLMTLYPVAFIRNYSGDWQFPSNVCSINRLPSSCRLDDYRDFVNAKVPDGYPVYKSAMYNPTNQGIGGTLTIVLLIIGALLVYDYYYHNWAYSQMLLGKAERGFSDAEKAVNQELKK